MRWEEGGGDKRNVESKKQKERSNKSAACGSREKVRLRGMKKGMGKGMGKGAISRIDEEKESRRKKNGLRKLK